MSMPAASSHKQCPYCAEQILVEAAKCKHCGEFLAASSVSRHAQRQPAASPGVAAVLSFFVPGLGQMYKGAIGAGFAFLIFTTVGYVLFILPGLAFHIWAIVDAHSNWSAITAATSRPTPQTSPQAKRTENAKRIWHDHALSRWAGWALIVLTALLYVFVLVTQ